jgi:diacylglycerol kinase family enzyme
LQVRVLEEDDDLAELARAADADALGMAGGDGSLGTVAAVAVERDLPFVPIPFGTRNHFARDLGLDVDDPLAALDAFGGNERRVDVGRAGDRLFLNNVSLGLYAELVHRRERHRRRRDTLARLRALLLLARDRGRSDHFIVDGTRIDAHVVLVANNAYELDAFDLGTRERLDDGRLHLYVAHGLTPRSWEDRSCDHVVVDVDGHHLKAAVDGEPALFETPLEFRIEPLALRVLVAPG